MHVVCCVEGRPKLLSDLTVDAFHVFRSMEKDSRDITIVCHFIFFLSELCVSQNNRILEDAPQASTCNVTDIIFNLNAGSLTGSVKY